MTTQQDMAMVTGAGSGLGRAIALKLAADGYAVAAVDLDEAAARETARQISAAGGRAAGYAADVSRAADIDRAVGAAIAALGPLEVMVNNAGILDGYFDVHEMDEALWRKVIEIDLTGVFLGCKHALKEFLPRGRGLRHLRSGRVPGHSLVQRRLPLGQRIKRPDRLDHRAQPRGAADITNSRQRVLHRHADGHDRRGAVGRGKSLAHRPSRGRSAKSE